MSNQLQNSFNPMPSLAQISSICNMYGIGRIIKATKHIENTANANIIIITDTGKYVIKIFKCDTDHYDFIMNALEVLKHNKLPALIPLKNKTGSQLVTLDTRMLQITRFVSGYPYNGSTTQIMNSGRMLRRFHGALSGIDSFVKPLASLYPSTDILKDSISLLKNMEGEISKEHISSIVELYDEIVDKWEDSKPKLPETIIHGDWHQNNLIFNKAEDVSCIMDFEFMTKAERIFDIAYALWRLQISKENLEIIKAFLQGYGSLTDYEIQYLPLEICRIVYYYICTSTLSADPKKELTKHMQRHYPFIKWVLSMDGQGFINNLCK